MNRTHALGFVSLFILGAATAFGACSSSSTTATPGVTTDSGPKDTGSGGQDTATGADTNTATDTATGDDSGAPTDAGADAGCSKVSSLHPPSADAGTSTIFCPFATGADGGTATIYCTGGSQHCCETPSGTSPSTCEALATTCPVAKSTDWQCQDPVSDCKDPTKPVCCAAGASIGLGTPAGVCGNFAHTMTATACVANEAACSGIILCTSNAECPSDKPTCTPFSKAGSQVGGCM